MFDEDGPRVTDEMVARAVEAYRNAWGNNDYVSMEEIKMRAALEAALSCE